MVSPNELQTIKKSRTCIHASKSVYIRIRGIIWLYRLQRLFKSASLYIHIVIWFILSNINSMYMYRKIVDSVEWMTSSEQLAEYVRMFRYEYRSLHAIILGTGYEVGETIVQLNRFKLVLDKCERFF